MLLLTHRSGIPPKIANKDFLCVFAVLDLRDLENVVKIHCRRYSTGTPVVYLQYAAKIHEMNDTKRIFFFFAIPLVLGMESFACSEHFTRFTDLTYLGSVFEF